jgi:hypothetical protein
MHFEKTFLGLAIVSSVSAGVGLVACSSSDESKGSGGGFGSTAAAVAGAADGHCGTKTITVSEAACKETGSEGDHDHDHDHGGGDADAGDAEGGGDMSEYGATLHNSEGDDDECKYHLKWTTDTIGQNVDVRFQVVATTKADGKPLAGAPISAEVFLDDTHPAPNSGATTTETSPGTYVVGPIRFDAAGKWTVRFHIHEECNDGETSPHGHVAFFAQVP